ncbi:uncharacterized protein LOC122638795 [Telopea speciosissima]|uniref:uncharacterized protein LOC122638795 n=1 Tax=Telopea speciosissima TaxID=54955 RepID=UPI001CC3E7AE|nr:uncharacterized protein LOC122638795 [Telopea speciosissima]
MGNVLKEKYNMDTTNMRMYRARWRAREETDGSHTMSFNKLKIYGDMIMAKNSGNSFVIQYQNANNYGEMDAYGVVRVNPQFKRMFICFDACIQGFLKGCRPFIGLDGCHLKGVYGGVLVSAVSVDGNNRIFSIAYGVVESEGKDSWLHESIERCKDRSIGVIAPTIPLTFMTDKQKGLIEAISTIFPQANHRHCSRHLHNNFKKVFGGMKAERNDAYDWLMKTPISMWSRHAFVHRAKSDHITNNMTESFNQWVGPCKDKSVLTLIDEIRSKLMGTLQKRFAKACNFEDVITSRMKKKLDGFQKNVRYCRPTYCGRDKYEVQDQSVRYVVDMENNICECGIYIATRLPCKHVGACIQFNRVPLLQYCASYYTTKRYLMVHEAMIDPMYDLSTLEEKFLLLPPFKRSIGRPNKLRKREPDEVPKGDTRKRSSTVWCSKCNSFDHNRRTCTGPPVNEKRPSSSQKKRKARSDEPDDITSS